MLKINELLTMFAIIDKASEKELRDLILLSTKELIKRKERQITKFKSDEFSEMWIIEEQNKAR